MKHLTVLFTLLLAACAPNLQDAREQVRSLSNDNGYASGVVLRPGLVLTAQHVTAVGPLMLRKDGRAGVLLASTSDPNGDLGLLYFPADEAKCPCVELAAYEARRDEQVYIIGYPRNIAQVVTIGQSQGVQRVVVPGMFGAEQDLGMRLITTGLVAGGNSGGGVFVFRDGRFQLVGILTEGVGHLSFAVPLVTIRAFLQANL